MALTGMRTLVNPIQPGAASPTIASLSYTRTEALGQVGKQILWLHLIFTFQRVLCTDSHLPFPTIPSLARDFSSMRKLCCVFETVHRTLSFIVMVIVVFFSF